MSTSDSPALVNTRDFLAKQVRALLICLAVLTAILLLGRPDGRHLFLLALWGYTMFFTFSATAGFIANLISITVLLTGGEVHRKTIHAFTAILSVFIAITASVLFTTLLGKPANPTIAFFMIIFAELAAHISAFQD